MQDNISQIFNWQWAGRVLTLKKPTETPTETLVLLLDLHFKNYEDKSVKLACFVKETASYICHHLGRGELEQVTTYIPVSRAPRHSWKSTSKGWEKIDIIVHNSPFLLNDTGTDLKTETCRSKFFTKPSPLYALILAFLFFFS